MKKLFRTLTILALGGTFTQPLHAQSTTDAKPEARTPARHAADAAPNHADADVAEHSHPTPTILHADEGEKLMLFGGRYVLLKATSDVAGAKELFMGSEALPPGSAIPVHSHDGYEEIIFIHEGNARLTLGDRTIDATAAQDGRPMSPSTNMRACTTNQYSYPPAINCWTERPVASVCRHF